MRAFLTPRFYYAFPPINQLRAFLKIGNSTTPTDFFSGAKPYFHNSGRTGLRLLLSSTLKENLNVGVQAYTCHSVFEAIHKAGNRITFIDIDRQFQLNLEDLRKKAPELDILIITHTFGNPERYEQIRNILGPKKTIIEDCAHAYGSHYPNGQFVGTLGDAAIFSFGIGKLPPVGQLGCTLVNQHSRFPGFKQEFNKLETEGASSRFVYGLKSLLLSIAMKPPLYGSLTRPLGKGLDTKFDFVNKFGFHESKGFPLALRSFNLNHGFIAKMLNHNRKNFKRLKNGIPFPLITVDNKQGIGSNRYIAAFLTPTRESLFKYLLAHNIEPGQHFFQSLEWAKKFGYEKGMCPLTEELKEQVITVPIHFGVKASILERIVKLIQAHESKKE